jgi:hypothetical protein
MMANQKKCSKCDELKPTQEFSKYTKSKDGLQGYCKSCNKKINDSKNPAYYTEYLKADKNGSIYRIVNPLGETYIGSTKRNLDTRFQMHRGAYKFYKVKGHSMTPKLHSSFDKWGIDAHIFELVKDWGMISKSKLREIESNMIVALKKNGKSLNLNN